MKEYDFSIEVSYQEWLAFYQGHYQEFIVTTNQGQRLQIQADHFTEFTTPAGLHGHFKVTVSPQNKVVSLIQL